MRISMGLKLAWRTISTVLTVLCVFLAIALVGVRMIGYEVYTVLSGSMEPAFPTGSVIYVQKIECQHLKVGDPITFVLSDDTVATHRIIEILTDKSDPNTTYYRTKGDANMHADGALVHCRNVIGKPVLAIPYLGYIAAYIQNPPGTYIAICVGIMLIVFVLASDIIKEDRVKRKVRIY